MTDLDFLPDVLRGAGIAVVEHDGWRTRGHGAFSTTRLDVVWHHDGTAPGPTPSGAAARIRREEHGDGLSGNVWVDTEGTWHLIVGEVAFHTGKVLAGMPDNHHAIGVETDHTTGETWSPPQVDSMRRGTAAILTHTQGALHFHKTICRPVGRKVDPDGLDLAIERAAVAALQGGQPAPPAPAPSPVPAGLPVLRRGSTGDAVATLQRAVGVTADGDFGPQTEAAVKAFQAAHGLAPDGVVGPQTWAVVNGAAQPAPQPAPQPASSTRPTVRRGDRDSVDVRHLQERLGLTADGDFGPKTEAAVKAFQAVHGLTPDGVVGPLTWATLG
jgi:peptidoglycan hydrolase-like protein with peptidoglycan-binding domain